METKFFKTFEDLIKYLFIDLKLDMTSIGEVAFELSAYTSYAYYIGKGMTYKYTDYYCELEILKLRNADMVYPIQLNVKKIDKI